MLNLVQDHVGRFLRRQGRSDVRMDRVVCLDVTNRLIDGTCYLLGDADRFPQVVAKVARTPQGQAVFETEFETLRDLQRIGMNESRQTTPEPLDLHREGDTLITLQSALPGTLMKNMPGSSLFSVSRADESIALVTTWWGEFQRRFGQKRLVVTEERYESEVLAHVRRFKNRFLLGTEERELLSRRFERERPLLGTELPFMARHGDFCTANMVLQDAGVGVFDWEFRLSHQTPLFDLLFFFSSVRYPYAGYRGESGHFDSFVEVYWGDSYFSRAAHKALLLACSTFGVPVDTLPDLLLLSLLQVANMKYDAFVASHRSGFHDLTDEEASEDEKARRFDSFRDADKDAPFACIRQGRLMSLEVFCERGFPSL
jgi:hypothetical protein